MKFMLVLFVLGSSLMFSGCAGVVESAPSIRTDNALTAVMMQKETQISRRYEQRLQYIEGRLKGIEEALIKSLAESLKTARVSRDMSEKALSVASRTHKEQEKIKQEIVDLEETVEEAKEEMSQTVSSLPTGTSSSLSEGSFSEVSASPKSDLSSDGFTTIE